MTHRNKQKLARKNRTNLEIKNKTPIFQTNFWETRKLKIKNKVLNSKMSKNAKIK